MRDKIAESHNPKPLPSQEDLSKVLSYNPESGLLIWRSRFSGCVAGGAPPFDERTAKAWNTRRAGRFAMQSMDRKGYMRGKLFGKFYLTHRVIWKLTTGDDPLFIDHINGVKSDNRIINLRNCTNAENSRNYVKGFGSSRFRGVCWVKRDKKWSASISNGKGGKISLGNYESEESAARAYDAAAVKLHNKFAIVNFPTAQVLSAFGIEGDG